MDFVSVRVITHDVERLATFWEQLTGLPVTRPVPVFAELRTPTGTIAIGAPATVGMLGDAAPVPGQNRSVLVELRVDDVDATWERVKGLVPQTVPEIVLEPMRRDSGPAIAAGAAFAVKRDGDPLIVALAADHVVTDPAAFAKVCGLAAAAATADRIVTFGVRPTRPATEYGYIRAGGAIGTLSDAGTMAGGLGASYGTTWPIVVSVGCVSTCPSRWTGSFQNTKPMTPAVANRMTAIL